MKMRSLSRNTVWAAALCMKSKKIINKKKPNLRFGCDWILRPIRESHQIVPCAQRHTVPNWKWRKCNPTIGTVGEWMCTACHPTIAPALSGRRLGRRRQTSSRPQPSRFHCCVLLMESRKSRPSTEVLHFATVGHSRLRARERKSNAIIPNV